MWNRIDQKNIRGFIYFIKKIAYLSIVVKGYFWYFFGMTACIMSVPRLVTYLKNNDVTLTPVILSETQIGFQVTYEPRIQTGSRFRYQAWRNKFIAPK